MDKAALRAAQKATNCIVYDANMLVMQFIGFCAAQSAAFSTDEPARGPGPLISLVVKYRGVKVTKTV